LFDLPLGGWYLRADSRREVVKYSEASLGRVFVIRLEDGDSLPGTIEEFAGRQGVQRGVCFFLGGVDGGSRLVVGPERGDRDPPSPITHVLEEVHEAAGVGTIFPDEEGNPVLHLHAACGRRALTRTGCVRPGVDIWKIGEVVLIELTGSKALRARDDRTGLNLLSP
jgi:predicted DNA-binding protein with PD1-like motif